jgi:hypothetical protein
MAAAKDYWTQVYNKLLSLANARADLTSILKGGNIVTFAGTTPQPRRAANATASDFPALWLYQTTGSDDMHTSPTFSEANDTFAASVDEWAEQVTQNYRYLIVGQDTRIGPVNQIHAEFLTAIRAAGIRLGLGYPLIQKITWKSDETERLPECRGARRFVIDGVIPVQMNFEGQRDLIS